MLPMNIETNMARDRDIKHAPSHTITHPCLFIPSPTHEQDRAIAWWPVTGDRMYTFDALFFLGGQMVY